MKKNLFFAFLILCGFSALAISADEQVRIYPLQHRSAAELLPQVEPLLGAGERASAAENHLVVIASPATLEAIAGLIEKLDRSLRQFRVQVRWSEEASGNSGHLGYDPARRRSSLSGQGWTLGTSSRLSGQALQVSERERAFILTGSDIPYSSQWAAWSGRYGQGFSRQIDFQKLRSGFSVRVDPLSNGEVQADITPQLMAAGNSDMVNPAVVTLDQLATVVRLATGTWIDLADFLPEASIGTRILAGTTEPLPSGRRLQLRIDEVKVQ